jgi:hypothetical protein
MASCTASSEAVLCSFRKRVEHKALPQGNDGILYNMLSVVSCRISKKGVEGNLVRRATMASCILILISRIQHRVICFSFKLYYN